ncbi:MAG: hypothetical protein QF535_23955, partial [Anaerolineales bacterium]|nr:hypothetical protein [Anaerolineales bacterium]
MNVTGSTYFGAQSFTNIDASGNVVAKGNLTVNNSVLFVDRDSGRIGIGTASPSQALTIAVSGTDEYSFSASTLDMNANTISDSGSFIATDAAGPTILNEEATSTNPTLIPNRAETDTGITWPLTDRVGIVLGGTLSSTFTTSSFQLNGAVTTFSMEGSSDSTIQTGNGANRDLTIQSNSQDTGATLTFRTTGVTPTFTMTDRLTISGGIAQAHVDIVNAVLDMNSNSIILDSDSDTTIGAVADDELTFNTTGSERIRIDSSGNVGIGTTNPADALTVQGTLNVTADGSGGPNLLVGSDGYTYVGNDGTSADTKARLRLFTSDDITGENNGKIDFLSTRQSDGSSDLNISLSPGSSATPSSALFIDGSSGNVGIGTTAPQYLLQTDSGIGGKDVNLSNVLYVNSSSSNVGIGTIIPGKTVSLGQTYGDGLLHIVREDATTTGVKPTLILERRTTGTSTDGIGTSLIFRSEVDNEAFRTVANISAVLTTVDSNGIGAILLKTLNPDFSETEKVRISNNMYLSLGGDVDTGINQSAANTLNLITAGTERLRIDSSGNVGIGTT